MSASLPVIEFPPPPRPLAQTAPPPGTTQFTTAHWVAWGLGIGTLGLLIGAVFFGDRD